MIQVERCWGQERAVEGASCYCYHHDRSLQFVAPGCRIGRPMQRSRSTKAVDQRLSRQVLCYMTADQCAVALLSLFLIMPIRLSLFQAATVCRQTPVVSNMACQQAKVWKLPKTGNIGNMILAEQPVPTLTAGQVSVAVRAVSYLYRQAGTGQRNFMQIICT